MVSIAPERRHQILTVLESPQWEMSQLWHQRISSNATLELDRAVRWVLVFSGEVELTISGELECVALRAGDAALLGPHTVVSLAAFDETEVALADLHPVGGSRSSAVIALPNFATDHEGVAALIRACPLDGECSREGACLRSLWAPSYAGLIGAATETSLLETGGFAIATNGDSIVARVLAIVADGLDENWTVGRMASLAHLSRSSLTERCRRATGRTPIELVRALRMYEARRLLADRNQSVGMIAFTVGYASVAAFSKTFSGFHGVSPRAWRTGGARSLSWQAKQGKPDSGDGRGDRAHKQR